MKQLKISQSITERSPIIDKYLQEIAREPLLTTEEEVELFRQVREGNEEAFSKIVRSNLRFVVSVAKQYPTKNVGLLDLINEGNLGLIKAAQKFDETRGFKFISYAVWWIRQSILQAIPEQSKIVRTPLNQVGALNKIRKAFSEFEQEFERQPSIDELSERVGIDAEKIAEIMGSNVKQTSFDAPFGDGDEGCLLDVMRNEDAPSPDNGLYNESLSTEVERVLGQLEERERDVVKMFFGLGCREMSLEEIGEAFNLTRERVRQIKEKAIRRLKGQKSRMLLGYLG